MRNMIAALTSDGEIVKSAAESQGTTTGIHSRSMLVRVTISTWQARKIDEAVTREVNEKHGATSTAARVNKHLFGGRDESPEHAKVVAAANYIRRVRDTHTLPWADEGWRLLPTANYVTFTDEIRQVVGRFESARRDFLREYDRLREDAKASLGTMYRDGDYPSTRDLEAKFVVRIEYSPVPAAGDFRIDLPEDQMRGIEDTVTERVKVATASAMTDCWDRLHDVVQKFKDQLSGENPTVRKALIENGLAVVEILGKLNVTNDPNLEAVRQQVARDLTSQDVETLKGDAAAREETVQKAEDILSKMAGFQMAMGVRQRVEGTAGQVAHRSENAKSIPSITRRAAVGRGTK